MFDVRNQIKEITEDLILQGDYVLTGDVVVENKITAEQFFGESQTLSLRDVLDNGLKLTDDVNFEMNFTIPLEIEQLNAKKLNEFNVSDFVRLNSSKIQIISGHKSFLGDLDVDNGLFEANNLNGEDLKEFKNKILCQTGNQEIKGNFTFKKVITKR